MISANKIAPCSLIFVIGVLSIILSGCTAARVAANKPRFENDVAVPRAGYPSQCKKTVSEKCDQAPFIAIAISGGGSRAANYSAAVLSELDSLGILEHVDLISSVSGGSLTAAYYATRGNNRLREKDKALFWQTAKADLSKDFRSAFVSKFLRPDNFLKTMIGPVGRSELMAGVFDENLFSGIRFGDLGEVGPKLIINATAINELNGVFDKTHCTNRRTYSSSMRWESISFTDDFFESCLRSSLSTYPISNAVAASAAFPGVFSSMPLARFGPDEKSERIVPLEFLHLIDGGPSDNLAIDGILSNWAYKSDALGVKHGGKCLIIAVDAFASGDSDMRNLVPDPRSITDRFVDSNFFDSIDSMLSRRRFETLQRLELPSPRSSIDQHRIEDFPLKDQVFNYFDSKRVAEDVNPYNALGNHWSELPKAIAAMPGVKEEAPSCMIWYVGIDSLKDLVAPDWEFLYDQDVPYVQELETEQYDEVIGKYFLTDEAKNRAALWDISSRIRTDFNLVGPKHCNAKILSDVLWEAGRYSIAGDLDSRKKVCDWLKDAGLPVAKSCAEAVHRKTSAFPVRYISHPNSGYSVECTQ